MSKYKFHVILLGAALFAALLVVPTREREPEYGGRKLSEWVELLGAAFENARPTPVADYDQAYKAIKDIGTNVVPYLVSWMRYDPPRLKVKIMRALRTPDKRRLLAEGTVTAFRFLGPDAKGAIPDLLKLLNEPKRESSAYRADCALWSLGFDPSIPVVAGLTNCHAIVRFNTAAMFSGMGTNARAYLPALVDLLKFPDPAKREEVTNVILGIDPQALQRASQ